MTTHETTSDALLTAQDVMAQLRVSRAFCTLHAADLGGIKVGNRLRFQQSKVEAYLDRQRVVAPVSVAPAPTPIRRPLPQVAHRSAVNPVTRQPWDDAPTARPGRSVSR